MKKLLALVLALVMTLSLCVTSNAAYSDAADVDYNEAVDVMSAVGVFQGSDGKFDPKANLTREQAAKLIAYLDLGESVAEALPAVKVFNDVAADRWSSKFVAYCADAGYIAGVGDGNFDPTGALTGYAFGKMLLCALGYSAEIENLTGASWMINVAKLMESNDIADDVDAAPSATLTREAAAQYCLNTLKATCVKYDNAQTVTIGNVEIKQSSKASAVTDGAYVGVYDSTTTLQLLEKLYKNDLTLSSAGSLGNDDFGRPVSTWQYKGKDVATATTDAVVTYSADMNSVAGKKQIAADLKGYKFKDANGDLTELKTKSTATGSYNITSTQIPGLPAQIDAGDTLVEEIADWTANGKVVEVYANSTTKVVTAVNTITYKVEKITAVTTNKDGDVTYNLSVSGAKIDYADDYANDDTIVLHGTFAKNDYVTTVDGVNSTDVHVYPTTKVVGTQTANNGTKLTIGGSAYTLGLGVDVDNASTKLTAAGFPNTDKDANYFVDQFGFVVACSDVSETLVYGVVNKIAGKNETTGLNTGKSVEAELVLADATKSTVKVSKINGLKVNNAAFAYTTDATAGALTLSGSNVATAATIDNTATSNSALANKIVTYKVDSDGKYELTYVDYAGANAKTAASGNDLTNKGVPGVYGTAPATTATVYVVKTTNSNGDAVFKAYTGYANVPTVAANGATLTALYATKDSKAVFVYINAAANSDVGESTVDNIFYVHSTTITTVGTGSDVYYTMNGILDGEAVAIKTETANFALVDGTGTMSADTFYKLSINEDGYVTAATATTGLVPSGSAVDADFIEAIGDGSFGGYLFNDKTKVVAIDADGELVENATVNTIAVGDAWAVMLPSTGTAAEKNTIETLYILVA